MIRIYLKLFAISCCFALLFFACGVPDTSIVAFPGSTDCNPLKKFPQGVQVGSKKELLFQNSKTQMGCLGVTWEGQSQEEVQGFLVRVETDGSYHVQDPATGKFITDPGEKLGFTVAAGIDKVNLSIYFYKGDGSNLKCTEVIRAGIKGCWGSNTCLLVWHAENVPVSGSEGTGSCKICHRETCNNLDDDCDGDIDNGQPCGTVFNQGCKFESEVKASTPGCSKDGGCACLIDKDATVHVCFGAPGKDPAWTKLSTVQNCKTGTVKNLAKCGKSPMICDQCGSQKDVWRSQSDNACSDGKLVYQP